MNYLKEYLDILPLITKQIQQDYEQISMLNSYSEDRELKITSVLEALSDTSVSHNSEEKTQLLIALDSNLAEACSFSKEKIAITSNCYDYVDKQIRRLDADLEKFSSALLKYKSSNDSSSLLDSNQKANKIVSKKDQTGSYFDNEDRKVAGINNQDASSEFPIDPNEPTYCFCKQVAFGEMVACDNDECDIKWFHFECIDMKTLPRGSWYCPECAPLFSIQRSSTSSLFTATSGIPGRRTRVSSSKRQ